MKRMLAIFIALAAMISGSLAAIMPDWIEELGPDTTYTYGEYTTARAIVEDSFTPQSLTSSLTFSSNGVSADIDQTVDTSIAGVSTGIDRQLLSQSASASVAEGPSLAIDAENDATATTLLMKITKDQTAAFSGKLTGGEVTAIPMYDYDLNDDGINDDPYSGGHQLIWNEYVQDGPAFTATFNDEATLTAGQTEEQDGVSLRQSVEDATVTISVQPTLVADEDIVFQIGPETGCVGAGEYWQGYAALDENGLYPPVEGTSPNKYTPTQNQVDGFPEAPAGSDAQLTEVAAGISSTASLRDTEIMTFGNIETIRTLDGSAALEGAFENAIVDAGEPVNIDLDGDIDIWFE